MTIVRLYMLSFVCLFATPWTVAHQVPLSMEFPGKNTGVGCHFLLQGIFPTWDVFNLLGKLLVMADGKMAVILQTCIIAEVWIVLLC